MSPVKFTAEIRYFLYAFQLFGISPFSEDKTRRVLLLLFSLFHLAVLVLLVYSAFVFFNIFGQTSLGTLAAIVGQLVFSGLIATSLIIILQSVIFREEALQIEDRFDRIHSLMKQKLFIDISVHRMRVKFFWKLTAIVLLLFAVISLNIIALVLYEEQLGVLLHSLWPIIIIRARCIHNIFLIDLLNEFTELLSAKVKEIIARKANERDERPLMYSHRDFDYLKRSPFEELMTLKDVYGYIWDVTNLINDAFGWSLLAVATQNFIEFTCNGYWLFLALDNKTSSLSAISECGGIKNCNSINRLK